jgi:multidrug efflux system membrane fusion protein
VGAFDCAREKQIATGKLASLDNEVDTTTGTLKFRAEFPNKNQALFPNQFVNARLLVRTPRKVVLVPSAALQHNGSNAFVYVVNEDKVSGAAAQDADELRPEYSCSGIKPGLRRRMPEPSRITTSNAARPASEDR